MKIDVDYYFGYGHIYSYLTSFWATFLPSPNSLTGLWSFYGKVNVIIMFVKS